ncbi:GNAT family N-acetyltransferase [Arenibacterium sp. CAU 1754]
MPERIRTPRLDLRPLQADDAAALFGIFSDADAMQYFDSLHTSLDETRAWVKGTLGQPARTTREFAILKGGSLIGKAGIWRAPELGFALHRDHWRQGIMHEALSHLIPYVFRQMRLAAITADVDPRNQASLRLLKRLGFTETHRATATLKIGGVWCDSVYFALPNPFMDDRHPPSA